MNNNMITEKLKNLAERTIDEAMTESNLESFLGVLVNCATYGAQNQLLIWKQNRNATEVAGIKIWTEEGRKVTDPEHPIMVLLPSVKCMDPGEPKLDDDGKIILDKKVIVYEKDPVYGYSYQPIPVFDISQVSGIRTEVRWNTDEIIDNIRKQGFLILEENEDMMPPGQPEGYYSAEDSEVIIHIPQKAVTDKKRYFSSLLSIYASTYLTGVKDPFNDSESAGHLDICLMLTKYCLHMYFLSESPVKLRPAAIKIRKLSHEEKKSLIYLVSAKVFMLIQYLTVNQLSFTDTAVMNGILDTGSVTDMNALLARLTISTADDVVLSSDIKVLPDKYTNAYTGCLRDLYHKKLDERIIKTMPPVKLPQPDQKGELKV